MRGRHPRPGLSLLQCVCVCWVTSARMLSACAFVGVSVRVRVCECV